MKHLGETTDRKVAALYADVPPDVMDAYRAFCRTCPYEQVTADGVDWAYLTNRGGGDALLMLSGALVIPDISWRTIAHFARKYRVIAPVYPAVNTMDELADGIAGILRREGVERAHVMGGSYGGFVAQVFVRRHPALTRSLVLSHTLPPDPALRKSMKKTMRWLPLLPERVLRWVMGRKLGPLMPAKTPETALAHAMYAELLSSRRLTKADILGMLARAADFSGSAFAPQDLAGWQGRVLLVMADDDPGTPEPVRRAMSALYPGARVHLFHGTGHAASILKEEEYQAVIGSFFEEVR
jgi:pimeloyl-ACP methyl ester carboxylesterase